MNITEISAEEQAALEVLRRTKAGVLEAALVAKEALEAGLGSVKRARLCIQLGEKELERREKTVSFEVAVAGALEARRDRRDRTQRDFRYICYRLMKRCPGLARRQLRSLSAEECAACLQEAFQTPRQFHKARAVLSGVFSTAKRRGWCSWNPVQWVDAPRLVERRIPILSPEEIRRLLKAAREYRGGLCLAAVGLMLYAGIRPHEVERLTWEQIDLENRVVSILPRHSKTGGSRQVTIRPPLFHILSQRRQSPETGVCPRNWRLHWRNLHCRSGWTQSRRWVPDILRHTFATYHLKLFRDYTELQYEIGHRSSDLLRTRYVDMRGTGDLAEFWMLSPGSRDKDKRPPVAAPVYIPSSSAGCS